MSDNNNLQRSFLRSAMKAPYLETASRNAKLAEQVARTAQ